MHAMPGSLGFPESQGTLAVFCNALGPASDALLRNEVAFRMLCSLVPPAPT